MGHGLYRENRIQPANEVIYYDYDGETMESAFDTTKIVPMSYAYFMEPMISSGGWISRPIDMVKIILSIDGLNSPPDILNAQSETIMSSVPSNIKTRYAMGMDVTKNNTWFHSGQCLWGTSALWMKTKDNICFAITCNTLPAAKGSDEEKLNSMKMIVREFIGFLIHKLEIMNSFPNTNLFDSKEFN